MHENIDMICDFRKRELNYQLPSGFHFVDPQKCDPVRLAICTWKGFNHEDKGHLKIGKTKSKVWHGTRQRYTMVY